MSSIPTLWWVKVKGKEGKEGRREGERERGWSKKENEVVGRHYKKKEESWKRRNLQTARNFTVGSKLMWSLVGSVGSISCEMCNVAHLRIRRTKQKWQSVGTFFLFKIVLEGSGELLSGSEPQCSSVLQPQPILPTFPVALRMLFKLTPFGSLGTVNLMSNLTHFDCYPVSDGSQTTVEWLKIIWELVHSCFRVLLIKVLC